MKFVRRTKNIVIYSRVMAVIRSDVYSPRLRLVLQAWIIAIITGSLKIYYYRSYEKGSLTYINVSTLIKLNYF
jgi:hypothetical protein